MFRRLREDAVELAFAVKGSRDRRALLATVFGADSYRILVLTRAREVVRRLRVPLLNHLLRVMQTSLFGIEIGNGVTLGRGVYFVHPVGVVVGGDARVGDRVRFYGSNTVGEARPGGGYPVIEDDVEIGAGARILGTIRVGKGATIGANSVVLCDVPAGSTAVGMPARILAAGKSARAV